MGCCGEREKGPPEATAKWTYINLSDFKSTSSWNTLAYIWVWVMAFVSVAVFAADSFTAVNLLAFNRWTSKIEPALKIEYARWIFAGCILFSFALIIFSWFFAIRAIRRGGIAESYMDPLAATLQSMRGSGWRRFLVFTNLTKSKKGNDYIAFFVYFSFQTAIRVIIAEGPRQVINGMTLYEVMERRFLEGGDSDKPNIVQFWENLQHLFNEDVYVAATVCAMLFTLIIWVISALSLLISLILYIVFLWHYIPQSDGRLKIYCRRKIDRRLEKIVENKIKEALEQEDKHARKAEQKAEQKAEYHLKKTGTMPPPPVKFTRQPTLPTVPVAADSKSDDKLPEFTLARKDTSTTVSTLPLYTSRPSTSSENPRLESRPSQRSMHSARPLPSRMATQSSGFPTPTEEMDAPLLDNAGFAGHVGRDISRPPTAMSRQESDSSLRRPVPARTMTAGSQASMQMYPPMPPMGPPGAARPFSPMSRTDSPGPRPPMGPPGINRTFSPTSRTDSPGPRQPVGPRMPIADTRSPPPGSMYNEQPPFNGSSRQNTPGPIRNDSNASFNRPPPMPRQPTFGSMHSQDQSFSRPAPPPSAVNFNRPFSPPSAEPGQSLPYPNDSYEMTSHPHITHAPAPPSLYAPSPPPAAEKPPTSGFVAFNPALHSASSTPAPAPPQIPQRSVTASPIAGFGSQSAALPPLDVPQRSFTAPAAEHLAPSPRALDPLPLPFDNRATIGYSDIVDDYGRADRGATPPRAGRGEERGW